MSGLLTGQTGPRYDEWYEAKTPAPRGLDLITIFSQRIDAGMWPSAAPRRKKPPLVVCLVGTIPIDPRSSGVTPCLEPLSLFPHDAISENMDIDVVTACRREGRNRQPPLVSTVKERARFGLLGRSTGPACV